MASIVDQSSSPDHSGNDTSTDGDCAPDCDKANQESPAVDSETDGEHDDISGQPRRRSRTMTLAVMAKEYIWLWDLRHGVSTKTIAMRERVPVRRVRYGVARAKAQEKSCPTETAINLPRLVPFFPIAAFTPQSPCGHRRPIRVGSVFCCMVCHRSGLDDHPALVRTPLTDPAPEPKPKPKPSKTSRETRKQRRQRVYGAHP
jgi:hypothetical protein